MKILIPVDGSKHALDAVKFVVDHPDWVGERPQIELLHVHPPVPKLSGLGSVIGKKQLQRYYEEEGAEALAASRELLDRAGLAYSARVLVGPPAETIVTHARSARIELLIIGHRGMSAAANMVLGSIASKVLHLSTVPVLLVK